MGIRVITDSTSYLTEQQCAGLDIVKASLNISFSDETFREIDIDNATFYEKMALKGIPTSSQPAIGELGEIMKTAVEAGLGVCGVFLSSDMSGTYQTACLAKEMVMETHPEAEIDIIDSRSNCLQLGFAALIGARKSSAGATLSEVKGAVLENIRRSRFLFIPENLVYLKKGGRIGSAAALLGNFLKIIPILTVEDGKTSILTKVRTKKNAVNTMLERMYEDIQLYGIGEIVVHHINCLDEAVALAALIQEKFAVAPAIVDIGPVIGLHVGPGAVGLVYYTAQNMRD